MKIRDKLLFIALLPMVLTMVVGIIQHRNADTIDRHSEKARIADDLYKKLAILNQLTMEHHLFNEERAHVQWQDQYATLGTRLAAVSLMFDTGEEQAAFARITRSHKTLGALFEQYGPHQPRGDNSKGSKFAERITNRILQEMEIVMPEVDRLHEINHAAAIALGQEQTKLFTIFIAAMAMAIPLSAALVFRSFSKPLRAVQQGIHAFAAGELGYRINATARDEIGEVARAFDRMAEQWFMAEEARRASEQMLVHQSRLAAMGEMIGAIAHQWRQPLNAVNAIIQDIKDAHAFQELDTEYLERSVKDAMQQIRFMSKTIDDFRNFFQPSKEKKVFDVILAADEVLTMLASQLKAHGITYRLACHDHQQVFENFMTPVIPCDAMEILGYENEMKQVFLNLINNAKDAIVERIAQGIPAPGAQPLITVDFEREGGRVVARVTDNGGGIPPKTLERIFEPYYSTKEQGKGSGIGLYMSKMIVENNMNGRLTARNVDNGAEFKIEVEAHGQA